MFITALCPTYRRPHLLQKSLALWQRQTHRDRHLVILDDGGTFDCQHGENWTLLSVPARFASLPAKYNALLALAPQSDAYLVWEDDDTYLPEYVALHAACLEHHELSKPAAVLSDYTGQILPEPAAGRFHSTLGFRRSLIERIGGWPETPRADFDQIFISRLHSAATSIGDPGCAFIYGWHTNHLHGQATMRSPADESWYQRYSLPPVYVGQLTPQLDARTEHMVCSN